VDEWKFWKGEIGFVGSRTEFKGFIVPCHSFEHESTFLSLYSLPFILLILSFTHSLLHYWLCHNKQQKTHRWIPLLSIWSASSTVISSHLLLHPPNIHWPFLINHFHMRKVLIIVVISIVPVFVIVLICCDCRWSVFGVILQIWFKVWLYEICFVCENERLLSFGVEPNLRDLLSRVTHLITKAHSFYITHSLLYY
jgi:hypothetical protein